MRSAQFQGEENRMQSNQRGYSSRNNSHQQFKNLRVKAEVFTALADHAFSNDRNLARCVEEAMADYMAKHGIKVQVSA